MAKRNTFTKLGSMTHGSMFTCDCCGRRTQETVGSELCPECYQIAGIENEISDGHAIVEDRRAELTQLINAVRRKGGTVNQAYPWLIDALDLA